MNERRETVLLLGYGNPGRLDDGLGPALAARVEALALPGVTVQADYQLCLEDAEAAARHDVVIFADAAASGAEPFSFQTGRAGLLPGLQHAQPCSRKRYWASRSSCLAHGRTGTPWASAGMRSTSTGSP